jgi:hypothetical protein
MKISARGNREKKLFIFVWGIRIVEFSDTLGQVLEKEQKRRKG